jgi:hypothetical protein
MVSKQTNKGEKNIKNPIMNQSNPAHWEIAKNSPQIPSSNITHKRRKKFTSSNIKQSLYQQRSSSSSIVRITEHECLHFLSFQRCTSSSASGGECLTRCEVLKFPWLKDKQQQQQQRRKKIEQSRRSFSPLHVHTHTPCAMRGDMMKGEIIYSNYDKDERKRDENLLFTAECISSSSSNFIFPSESIFRARSHTHNFSSLEGIHMV